MVDFYAHVDQAKQFMPFAALKGYYDLIRQQERIPEQRRELTEEECQVLSQQIMQLHKGDMVRVRRYDQDAYVDITGVVTQVDTTLRDLWVVRRAIPFDDIAEIEKL